MAVSKPVDVHPDESTPLEPGDPVEAPSLMGGTFAERAKAREAFEKKQVDSAENKAVNRSHTRSK